VIELFPCVVPTGLKHGTITVLAEDLNVEVTTFRAEAEYSDGRHPDAVRFVATIEEDLARRDFTVNPIAFYPLRGVTYDRFDGRGDIRDRRCARSATRSSDSPPPDQVRTGLGGRRDPPVGTSRRPGPAARWRVPGRRRSFGNRSGSQLSAICQTRLTILKLSS